MPRMGRVVLPEYPHHVVQRGHDRNVVFATGSEYQYYLNTLAEFKDFYGVKVYAFCLMTNHVHLLLSPSDSYGLGQLMKRLAGRQTRYRNKLEGRSGTLWESRYKSSIVDLQEYLLACVRYIELNPVRACMVADPVEYQWSSYRARVGKEAISWLDDFPGNEHTEHMKQSFYFHHVDFVKSSIPDGEWERIGNAVERNQLTGEGRFVDEVNSIIGRRIEFRGRGRPCKQQDK